MMTDNEIIKALECCVSEQYTCEQCPYQEIKHYDYDNGFEIMPNGKQYDDWSCERWLNTDLLDLINRQKAEIKWCRGVINSQKEEISRLNVLAELGNMRANDYRAMRDKCKTAKAEAIKEFAEKIDELLKRYSHLHKRADEVRRSTEEYVDGTPMEMVSVWEVLSLKKWEMADYENMNTLQDNIETIAIERLLTEIEKDFRLLKKEMTSR